MPKVCVIHRERHCPSVNAPCKPGRISLSLQQASVFKQQQHGIDFETACEVFFDPLFRLDEASRNDEARDAVIDCDAHGCLLHVVHVEVEDEYIRITSARKATRREIKQYDS